MSKRKFDTIQTEDGCSPMTSDIDDSSNCSSVMTNSSSDVPTAQYGVKKKKAKKSVQFEGVNVYYFPRSQGFTCIPSEGGSTLGMELKHAEEEYFSIVDHAREQKRIHQLMLEEHKKLGKMMPSFLDKSLNEKCSDDEEEEEEEEEEDSDFEDMEDYIFLQPVSIRQRRTLLRQAGVKKIDVKEKEHCKEIRVSREVCGCDCKVYCDPETCACSKADIKCQVDRLSFPCGCSKDGCGNPNGRIEFNPVRVRTHFIHTLMRLQLEKRQEDSYIREKVCSVNADKSLTSAGTSVGTSVDKRQLDLSEFNSNELGSCRDCQNSEVCSIMMQEVKQASLESEQHRSAFSSVFHQTDYKETLQHCANSQTNVTNPLPRVLLFNDTEEDIYNAENTTSFYSFKQEDGSYSETSECSSESSPTVFDNNHYQKTYQNISVSSFHNDEDNANQEICSQNPQTNYLAGNQGNQKYMSLNSSSHMYRLDPTSSTTSSHSESYPSAIQQQQQWTSDKDNRSNYHPADASVRVPARETTLSSCSYTTMTNTTSDQIAATCPGISSHINSSSPGIEYPDSINVPKYDDIESFNIKCTDLPSKVYVDLDHNAPPVTENSDQCLLLESSSQVVNREATQTNNTESYPAIVENISSSSAISEDVPEKFQQNSATQNHGDILRSKDNCSDKGQNFGEIIKESIFETVSA